ncbi:hypothetical protein D1O33_25075 (plasmid) [Rhodococcus rhodochrous]|uniref:tubulin-like doman-containing protein n=1 Tax=Rhodococcus rhodochrous TaxID=1829 RepID=UPI00132EBE64|nr:tubulin-like doman-containing protein [Rhodococcus rhodochrous]QHG85314.1 hypothetical protein D1O33_25075 [Rhodococcus rhodochrous]
MALSLYHSATGKQAPHCINVVGLGKAGAQLIDAFLRTGEIEDLLEDPRARFTALAVDIGDGDMRQMQQYAASFRERLESRGIPTDRAQIKTLNLEVPTAEDLMSSVSRIPEYLGREFPRFEWSGADSSPTVNWIAPDTAMPNPDKHYEAQLEVPSTDEHVSRSVAKAIYNRAYYEGDRPAYQALREFASSIDDTGLPCLVFVAFGVGGGTGSGIVVDLARHLTTGALGRRVPVIGVGFLPCSGDPEYRRGASVYTTLNEIDCMLDESKNDKITAIWGDMYKNPFTGGFLALPQEQSWERLFRYTTIKKGVRPEIRRQQALHVTNKFVDDSFARYVVHDYGREIFRVLRPAGFTGAPHETVSFGARNFTIFNVAKLMHPGVEVVPGEPMSKWRSAISDWVGYLPKWMGLKDGFKTDHIEAHTYSARGKWNGTLQKQLEDVLSQYLLPGEDGYLYTTESEFFDALTLYTNVIIPGVAKTDLTAFDEAKKLYDTTPESNRVALSSSLLELGIVLSEPSEQFEGMMGQALPGAPGWNTRITALSFYGKDVPRTAVDHTREVMAEVVPTVVPTP